MPTNDEPSRKPPSLPRRLAGDGKPRRWKIADLTGDAREAIIEHEGQDYRLRVTANDKLILTK